ncbi:MAG: PorV/PorQ family protein [Ignavibacteriaceae bacterium]
MFNKIKSLAGKNVLILILLAAGFMPAQTKVGSTAAPFLNIGIGPRAVAMGGAFVATSNDVTALYWNPAGASRAQSNGALFSHSKWFADISYNWAGAMLSMGDLGVFGLSINYLDYGEMEVTTLREPEGTGEMFNPQDLVMALTYGFNLTDRFSIGANVKYVNQKIWNSTAGAIAFDLGVLFLSDIYGLRIGATITNFGSDMQLDGKDLYIQTDINRQISGNNDEILAKLNTDSYPLPLTFRVGVAMDVVNLESHRFTVAADALHPNDNAESLNIGAEYVFMNMIAIRGGYKSLFLENSEEGLTLGFGVNYDFDPSLGLFFDYAFQEFGRLDNTQQFSVGVKF